MQVVPIILRMFNYEHKNDAFQTTSPVRAVRASRTFTNTLPSLLSTIIIIIDFVIGMYRNDSFSSNNNIEIITKIILFT